MLESFWQDLRHAVRSLRRRPLVMSVAVLSLALGIGVNTAIFSVFDRLLLRSLPVPAPHELVNVTSPGPRSGVMSTGDAGGPEAVFSYPLFRDLERVQTAFTALGGFRDMAANISFRGQTISGEGLLVSGGYFPALRMRPALGRLLTADDDRDTSASDVVVLSHRYWTTRFAANPAVLNDTLTLNGVPMTIVGVAAPGFTGTSKMENERFFVPLRMAPRITRWQDSTSRRHTWIYVLGRLKPGVSLAQAEAQLRPPFVSLIREVELPALRTFLSERAREAFAARTIVLQSGHRGQDGNREETQIILGLMFAVTGFVLLIACANVANLLLARATERASEVAVRFSVGASAWQIFRLLFIEAGLLGLLGGAGALIVAQLTVAGLLTLMPASDAELLGFELDGSVLLFTAGLSIATALLFGLAPALHMIRARATSGMVTQGRSTGTRGTARLRTALAGGQIALATALLALAGLFIASLTNLARVDLGIQRAGLSQFRLAPVLNAYTPERAQQLFAQVESSLRQLPDVVSVSESTITVLGNTSDGSNMTVSGFTAGPDANTNASSSEIGTRYFSTLGIPLVAGREFTDADTANTPRVAIVNEAFVRKFRLGGRAIGARIGTTEGRPPDIEIVGVVADAAYRNAREAPPPQFFRPYRQSTAGMITFYVRTAPGVNPAATMAAVPAIVRRFDANLPVEDLWSMDAQFDDNTTTERVLTTLSSSFAGLATLLAAIGLYAVLAYSVSQRVREIGIRMALGARALDVRWMVLAQTGRITVAGALIGAALAAGIAQLGRSLLFGVEGFDLRAQAGAAGLMVVVALCAGLLPARRAAAVNPTEALRAD
jgi:predicted permease